MPMNLPNLLTLSRIVAIPLVILTFFLPAPVGPWAGCVLFAAAGITDWLDGQLARRWHQQSEWGRVLDPIADKLLVATILFMLAALQRITPVTIFPALVILAREILVSGLREHLAMLQVPVPVSRLAKWKTAIQMVAIGVLLVGDAGPSNIPVRTFGEALLWIAAVLTIVTGYDYLRAGMSHIGDADPVKGAKPGSAP
jgi:cardiolipin synthase (CMP-forming)